MKKNSMYLSLYFLITLACSSTTVVCSTSQNIPDQLIYLAASEETQIIRGWPSMGDFVAYTRKPATNQFFPLSEIHTLLKQANNGKTLVIISTKNLKRFFLKDEKVYHYQQEVIPAAAYINSYKHE